jgi:hypothetical protein
MEAAWSSEMVVPQHITMLCHNPEDFNFTPHRGEDFKSRIALCWLRFIPLPTAIITGIFITLSLHLVTLSYISLKMIFSCVLDYIRLLIVYPELLCSGICKAQQ